MLRCALALACLLVACTQEPTPDALGSLHLALTSHAGGVDYRLVDARFVLEGPERRGLSADGDGDELAIELTAGTYTLTLLDGWALERVATDGGLEGGEVAARLVSQNPVDITIVPGTVTRVVLRFELIAGPTLTTETGTLLVGFEVEGDAGALVPPCHRGLRISEVDYDQEGPDDGEFVEIINVGPCPAKLAGISLELVNGGDGKVYARYDLGEAARTLAPDEFLLVADPALLDALSPRGPSLPLRGTGLQNGPDGVRLVRGEEILDALSYEGNTPGAQEGAPASADVGELSLSRCPHGFDSDDNALDFVLTKPTPFAPNACEG